MRYDLFGQDMVRSVGFRIQIDFDTLRLSARGIEGDDIDRAFESLAQLQRVVDARIAPMVADGRCFDSARSRPVPPLHDLLALSHELRACGFDWEQAPLVADDPIECLVARLVTQMRRELNRALGSAQTTLEHVVLIAGDSLLKPGTKDPPLLAGLDEPAIERAIDGGSTLTWIEGELLDFGMPHEGALGEPLWSQWPDPDAYGPHSLLGALLYLAAARIEAAPKLRANVAVPGAFRIFIAYKEMEYVLFDRRARARAFAERPAAQYFEQCRTGAPL